MFLFSGKILEGSMKKLGKLILSGGGGGRKIVGEIGKKSRASLETSRYPFVLGICKCLAYLESK